MYCYISVTPALKSQEVLNSNAAWVKNDKNDNEEEEKNGELCHKSHDQPYNINM